MPELHQLEKQDLINLQKVVNIDMSKDASYFGSDGKTYSSNQREETLYRINVEGEDEVYLFVFKNNKLVDSTKTLLSEYKP